MLIAALKSYIEESLKDLLTVVDVRDESLYQLQVSMHGIRLLFRVELSMKNSAVQGNVCAYILSSDFSNELKEGAQVAMCEFPSYAEGGCIKKNERTAFASKILAAVSNGLAKENRLKLQ